jgi:hypothetical protein
MPRSKRRKSGWLPFVVPVHFNWRPHVGDRVVTYSPTGDPRDCSTSLEPAYIAGPEVGPKVPVGPLLLSGFIDVEPLTDEECRSLEARLGVPITTATREEIDAAIYRMSATIALSARIPSWDAFRRRLQAIIKSGQDCINATQQFVRMADPSVVVESKTKGALSLDQAVKTYLSLAGIGDSLMDIKLQAILAACHQGLEEVGPRASKRGPKGSTLALWRFLQSIETATKLSEVRTTLPSDSIREKFGPEKSTAPFDFGRQCLEFAIAKGKAAIGAASLSDSERTNAERVLSHLGSYTIKTRKSEGALLSRWRDARRGWTGN